MSVSELRNRQVTNVLGNLWHLLNPALNILIFYLIFGLLLKVDRGIDNFILFLSDGPVHLPVHPAGDDGRRPVASWPIRALLKGVQFPRALLPITATVTETLASLSSFVVLFVIALLTSEPMSVRWLLLIPVVAVQCRLQSRCRDDRRSADDLLPGLHPDPAVLLPADALLVGRDLQRRCLRRQRRHQSSSSSSTRSTASSRSGAGRVFGGDLDLVLVLSGTVWSVVLCVGGFLWFRAGEERYARD